MVSFEWDELKATSNPKKHGVDFADAVSVSMMSSLSRSKSLIPPRPDS
jgi:uncharacterized DUF497 family protein